MYTIWICRLFCHVPEVCNITQLIISRSASKWTLALIYDFSIPYEHIGYWQGLLYWLQTIFAPSFLQQQAQSQNHFYRCLHNSSTNLGENQQSFLQPAASRHLTYDRTHACQLACNEKGKKRLQQIVLLMQCRKANRGPVKETLSSTILVHCVGFCTCVKNTLTLVGNPPM